MSTVDFIRRPSVILSGRVVAVRDVPEPVETLEGAGSIYRDGRPVAFNAATVEVETVYKGRVAVTVEIFSAKQNGVNLGTDFRAGPIFIHAFRTKDGRLATNLCFAYRGLRLGPRNNIPTVERLAAGDWDDLSPFAVLIGFERALTQELHRLERDPGDSEAAATASQLLKAMDDGERLTVLPSPR